ncbi:PREDICTED: uncharacterized protein LOC104818796 [Tarenaya hassleriana]|uniref:uncharacterized protein LOC104818796 n=1 Tax=Tarenaya hassleriana TaxID=28532 RepID=UPI00053C3680|nr:PREDICTED: uncharacterized protein LOC104818796 [Tarenaya hassleriana]
MARLHLIIILFFFFFSAAFATGKPHAFMMKVSKHDFGYLYYSSIEVGTAQNSFSVNLVLDLSSKSQFPWFDCSATRYNSSSYRPFRFGSPGCKLVKNAVPWDCPNAIGAPPTSFCFNQSCGVFPISDVEIVYIGSLGEDIMRLGSRFTTPPVVFSCVNPSTAGTVPESSPGILSLSRHVLSLPMQLASSLQLPRKFALCLPSNTNQEPGRGSLFIGGGPYLYPPYSGDASGLFATTSFVTNPAIKARHKGASPGDYFVDVRSIEVDGETIRFDKSILSVDKKGKGGTTFDITRPYTYMRSSIFNPFIKAFKAKARARKMIETTTYAPYSACFDRKSVRTGIAGPDVPAIDLVLRDGKKWRIYGSNLMVDDGESWCLTVQGGSGVRPAILIGGILVENNLMEFDIESSKFSVTSSLLLHNTSCTRSATA